MAGSDPKANRAPLKAARRDDLDSDEDPLVELARIVSEDSGFAGPKLQKAKMTRHEQNSRSKSSDGLEAELLQELETAFPVRDEPAASQDQVDPHADTARVGSPALAEIAPVRRPVEEDPDPDQLLRSIEEQLSQFERRQAHRFTSTPTPLEDTTETATDVEEQSFDEREEESSPLPFGAPRKADPLEDDWQRRPTSRIRPFAESVEAQDGSTEAAAEPATEDETAPPPAPRSEYRFRGPANADWDRADAASREKARTDLRLEDALRVSRERAQALRPAEPSIPEAEAASEGAPANGARRGRPSISTARDTARRERLAAAFPEFDEEPQASELPAPDLSDVEGSFSRDFDQPFAVDSSGAADKWQDGDAPAEEPRVAAAIAPAPSRRAAAARAAAQQRSRSRLGMLIAAFILVVVIGGGAAFYLRSSENTPSGPPPVIAADPGEVRVEASNDDSATEAESAGDAVYSRVAGTTPPAQEQVVENSEEPREVARIVLPPSQSPADTSVMRPVGAGETAPATTETAPDTASPSVATTPSAEPEEPANAETEIGPRRVPTFVVKADGSIVATTESGAPAEPSAPSPSDQVADTTQPIEPVAVPTVAIGEAATPTEADAPAAAENTTPPATSEVAAATPPASAAGDDMATRPTIDEPPAEVAATPTEAQAAPSPPAVDPASTEVAAVAPSETQPPPPTVAEGGYLVQISSERSMEQAQSAYAAAQQRFPSVLGSLTPQIQRADIEGKGTYFRVKVGPWATRNEAVEVCESLRAVGGNCIVTR